MSANFHFVVVVNTFVPHVVYTCVAIVRFNAKVVSPFFVKNRSAVVGARQTRDFD